LVIIEHDEIFSWRLGVFKASDSTLFETTLTASKTKTGVLLSPYLTISQIAPLTLHGRCEETYPLRPNS
jgi:hypothetical protein